MVSERRTDFEKTDIVMLVLVVVLTVFGLAMLLSASEYNGRSALRRLCPIILRNSCLQQLWDWESCI